MKRQIVEKRVKRISVDTLFYNKGIEDVIADLQALKLNYNGRNVFFRNDHGAYGDLLVYECREETDKEYAKRIKAVNKARAAARKVKRTRRV